MQSIAKQLNELATKVQTAMDRLGIAAEQQKLDQLQTQMQQADFWDDSATAGQISREAAELDRHINEWTSLLSDIRTTLELAEIGDSAMQPELNSQLQQLQQKFARREFELKLSGEYDKRPAILSIYAGTGGTDAQDWAEMLERMYLRYAEANNWTVEILDRSPGEEAGIKSVTLEISGPYAYGKLKSEKGVHRLVRLSPFNADNLRQTSFALVDVIPRLEENSDIQLDPKQLRIDVFRSGGHGGQSVNTTDSAVRITHIPTGVTVAIQNERSQLQNKEKAMAILRSRLALLMAEQHREKLDELRGPQQSAEWGSQIRSYVLHPYTKVKDHRTGYETSQAKQVLDGEIGPFIDAYLASQVGK